MDSEYRIWLFKKFSKFLEEMETSGKYFIFSLFRVVISVCRSQTRMSTSLCVYLHRIEIIVMNLFTLYTIVNSMICQSE